MHYLHPVLFLHKNYRPPTFNLKRAPICVQLWNIRCAMHSASRERRMQLDILHNDNDTTIVKQTKKMVVIIIKNINHFLERTNIARWIIHLILLTNKNACHASIKLPLMGLTITLEVTPGATQPITAHGGQAPARCSIVIATFIKHDSPSLDCSNFGTRGPFGFPWRSVFRSAYPLCLT